MRNNLKWKLAVGATLCTVLLTLLIGEAGPGQPLQQADGSGVLEEITLSTGASLNRMAAATTPGAEITEVKDETPVTQVVFNLRYDKYSLTNPYLVAAHGAVNIRKGPSLQDQIIRKAKNYEKLDYVETVTQKIPSTVQTEDWYHVSWIEQGEKKYGFVHSSVVSKRVFEFDRMLAAVLKGEEETASGRVTYISNYQNTRGMAPLYYGQEVDGQGGRRSQSAPGYPSMQDQNNFVYLDDGTLVRILGKEGGYTKIELVKDGRVFYVPDQYISSASLTAYNKVIVIDRKNQNEAVFEKGGGGWQVISYSLATTGASGEYQQPTPLGYFYAMEKRPQFYYYRDGTTEIDGYAPYVVRFSGGAYIHGVPVQYQYNGEGKRITPGKIEASPSLGTVPKSHKCVRNYTSHAKFIYDWYVHGETVVIVIE